MKKIVIASGLLAALAFQMSSCVKKDFDTPPDMSNYDPQLEVTHSIAELKSLAQGRALPEGTIAGVVVMDDRSGNYYKKIVIQDSTGGIEVLIDQNNIYNDYPIGRKIYINFGGLFLGNYGQNLQLGSTPDASGSISNIPFIEVDKYIVKANTNNPIIADTLTLAQLANPGAMAQHLNTLVAIKDVEFSDAYINTPYAQLASLASATNLTVKDCNGGTITMRNSGYAKFQPVLTPAGKGTLVGIYTRYNNTPQIYIRDTSDVKFTELRCDGTLPGPPEYKSIADLKAQFNGSPFVASSTLIRGVVISDKSKGNVHSNNVIIQDGDKGIMVRFSAPHSLEVGDSVQINITSATVEEFRGTLQVNNVLVGKASVLGNGTITPKVITIAEALANFEAYESTLVTIQNATIATPGTFAGNKTLMDGTGTMILFTSNTATFANETAPTNAANFTGVLGQRDNAYQLQIRSLADIN